MEIDSLRNDALRVSVKRRGAELTSITDPRGTEYLWQGDPLVWDGRSPVLFPIVGRLSGDSYSCAGRVYSLPQHGFARRRDFDLVAREAGRLVYALRSDQSTLGIYPFPFDLTITYTLEGSTVRTVYTVANPGSAPLPFSIGAHPGLSCSWHAGDGLEEYYLEFEREETADAPLIRDGLLALDQTRRVLSGEKILPLTRTLFDANALVLRNLASSAITLRSRRHPNAVRIGFAGFPCLGIWSKPAAPFVCIEPWFGHADPAGRAPGAPIESKPGIVVLPPNRSFECSWQASVL